MDILMTLVMTAVLALLAVMDAQMLWRILQKRSVK